MNGAVQISFAVSGRTLAASGVDSATIDRDLGRDTAWLRARAQADDAAAAGTEADRSADRRVAPGGRAPGRPRGGPASDRAGATQAQAPRRGPAQSDCAGASAQRDHPGSPAVVRRDAKGSACRNRARAPRPRRRAPVPRAAERRKRRAAGQDSAATVSARGRSFRRCRRFRTICARPLLKRWRWRTSRFLTTEV